MENQKQVAEKKTSQQQGEYKRGAQLEGVKTLFINLLMRNGEKSKAQRLFELSLNQLQSTDYIVPEKKTTSGEFCERKNQTFFDLFNSQKRKKKGKKSSLSKNCAKNTTKTTRNTLSLGSCEKSFFLKDNTLYQAVENVKPTLELRRVRKGGTTYQVPAIVNRKRQERLAIKWIVESAEKRKRKSKKSFSDCLVREIMEAFNKTGQPRQKRDEQLKIAEYNRAYTRYRWW